MNLINITQGLNTSTIIIVSLVIILGVLVYMSTKDSEKYFCSDYSLHPRSTLDGKLIGKMISTYEDNQLTTLNNKNKSQDTQHVTIDLETLEKFIYHIKEGVKAHSTPANLPSEKLKLRIYYAAYPEVIRDYDDLTGVDLTDAKRLTAVIFPVRENENGEDVVFDPSKPDTYEESLLKYEESIDTGESKDTEGVNKNLNLSGLNDLSYRPMAITVNSSDNIRSQNHGTMFP